MTSSPQYLHAGSPSVVAMILAGREGRRLYPLTRDRAKPAVPFGGHYRIIDFVLSNFVNSGVFKLNVLTQYKAGSLIQHLARGWQLAPHMGHYVAPVPASMKVGRDWYRGNADAVFQNLDLIANERPAQVCVFGADHIYKMDVRQMLASHLEREADVTVAVIPVPAAEAHLYGIVEQTADGRVTGFQEKPAGPPDASGTRPASMGLYVFTTEVLVQAIRAGRARRLGARLRARRAARDGRLPSALRLRLLDQRGAGHERARARLLARHRHHRRLLARLGGPDSEGCIISGGQVDRSILAPRVRVNSFADVSESILFDDVEVGRHAQVRRAIIDKGVVVPPGTAIGYDADADRRRFTVSEQGIVVIPKGALLDA